MDAIIPNLAKKLTNNIRICEISTTLTLISEIGVTREESRYLDKNKLNQLTELIIPSNESNLFNIEVYIGLFNYILVLKFSFGELLTSINNSFMEKLKKFNEKISNNVSVVRILNKFIIIINLSYKCEAINKMIIESFKKENNNCFNIGNNLFIL